jgi:large subunit ribosomal protein L18
MISVLHQRQQRQARVRAKVKGTAERPRLSVRVTNRQVIAQLVDDSAGRTLAYISTVKSAARGNLTAKAAWAGEQVATAAQAQKIKRVVFDRGFRRYHGRVKALAEAVRHKGLEL